MIRAVAQGEYGTRRAYLETGEFLSSDIVVNKGPHPEADSDFALFCEVVSEALT